MRPRSKLEWQRPPSWPRSGSPMRRVRGEAAMARDLPRIGPVAVRPSLHKHSPTCPLVPPATERSEAHKDEPSTSKAAAPASAPGAAEPAAPERGATKRVGAAVKAPPSAPRLTGQLSAADAGRGSRSPSPVDTRGGAGGASVFAPQDRPNQKARDRLDQKFSEKEHKDVVTDLRFEPKRVQREAVAERLVAEAEEASLETTFEALCVRTEFGEAAMGEPKFGRLLGSLQGQFNGAYVKADADWVFSKVCPRHRKTINFEEFERALAKLAVYKGFYLEDLRAAVVAAIGVSEVPHLNPVTAFTAATRAASTPVVERATNAQRKRAGRSEEVGGHVAGTRAWWPRGGHTYTCTAGTWRAHGGHTCMVVTWRARGGYGADTWRVRGGHMAGAGRFKGRAHGGHVAGTWRALDGASTFPAQVRFTPPSASKHQLSLARKAKEDAKARAAEAGSVAGGGGGGRGGSKRGGGAAVSVAGDEALARSWKGRSALLDDDSEEGEVARAEEAAAVRVQCIVRGHFARRRVLQGNAMARQASVLSGATGGEAPARAKRRKASGRSARGKGAGGKGKDSATGEGGTSSVGVMDLIGGAVGEEGKLRGAVTAFASFGSPQHSEELCFAKFSKLCNDIGIVDSTLLKMRGISFTRADVNEAFAKFTPATGRRRMGFADFERCLSHLADKVRGRHVPAARPARGAERCLCAEGAAEQGQGGKEEGQGGKEEGRGRSLLDSRECPPPVPYVPATVAAGPARADAAR